MSAIASAPIHATRPVARPGHARRTASRIFGYSVLILTAIFLFNPIFWILVNSLKKDNEYQTYPIQLFPAVAQWSNYVKVFTLTNFAEVALRTAVLGISIAIIGTFISAMAGFAFARYQVPGNARLFSIIIAMLIVPGIVLLIPQFILYARLKLTNTYWPWILEALGGGSLSIFLFRQFFLGFPRELEEAAEVDGCGPFRMFMTIFLPNAKPVIAIVMIFAFQGIWGDYLKPLLLLSDQMTLLGVRMAKAFVNPNGNAYLTITLAATVLYILPLVITFFFAQKYILKGVIMTGIKG